MPTRNLTSPSPVDSRAPDVSALVAHARSVFESGATRSRAARREHLDALRRLIVENRARLEGALHADLRKSAREAGITEIDTVLGEISHVARHLSAWTSPRRASTPIVLWPASARMVPEPLGVVLIMSPWNYPLQLTLDPLVGVLAAGNTAVIKPSPESPRTSELLAELVPAYFPGGAVQVVLGDVEVAERVLEERFDHIIFTGSGRVGRIVMSAAARHLTPVTLELGGKSPVWFDDEAHLADAARRLAWAKFTNAGQTCVAPDYVMTTPDRVPALVEAMRGAIEELWGRDPAASGDYGRIVSERHFDRLAGYLDEGTIEIGGQHDREDLYIAPTVITFPFSTPAAVGPDAPHGLLREEVFGPILPIIVVDSPQEAVRVINGWDKPLALYVFSDCAQTRRLFEQETSSGAVLNHAALIHVGAGTLPFGGVGASGMGAYHGYDSIRTFSHFKPVLTKPRVPDTLRLLNPGTHARISRLLGRLQRRG
ncbi:aldehyde dehydrogenase family protein [Okibacterium endophyticum]